MWATTMLVNNVAHYSVGLFSVGHYIAARYHVGQCNVGHWCTFSDSCVRS